MCRGLRGLRKFSPLQEGRSWQPQARSSQRSEAGRAVGGGAAPPRDGRGCIKRREIKAEMDLAKVGGGRTAHWRARPAALEAVVPARAGLSRQGRQASKQAYILLSGITTIDNPAARNLYLDVTSTDPLGITNQEIVNHAGPWPPAGPG